MGHPVSWFQISGREGGPLQDFYQKVFGWKMGPSPDGSMMMVKPDKGGIAGGIGPSRDGTSNVTVYIECDDVEEHLRQIGEAGGQTVMPMMELPAGMGFIAGFTDPAGNWVGLWQPGKPAKSAKKAAKRAKKPAKKAAKKKKAKTKAKGKRGK